MRKFFYVLSSLACIAIVLGSCKKKDEAENTSLYNDAAITEFTLGSLSQYKMVIDQIGSKVYNRDSLPLGTAVNSVACTVKTLNSGAIYLKRANEEVFDSYSSGSAIDFTQPRILRIVSTDGSYTRDYTVTLNVKKQAAVAFSWKQKAADVAQLQGCTNLRLVAIGTQIYAFTLKDGAAAIVKSTDEGATWTTLTPNLTTPLATNAWENILVKDGKMHLLNNGTLFTSTDGTNWQQVATQGTPGLKQLFGNGTKELFALDNNGGIKASTDGGINWTDEKIVATAALPTTGIASVYLQYAQLDSADYVLMVGNDGQKTVTWRKISKYGGENKGGQWVNIPIETTNKYPLPLQSHLSLAWYAATLLAYGTGTTAYQTSDQGITWTAINSFSLPEAAYSVAPDAVGHLYAICPSGKVFMGGYF